MEKLLQQILTEITTIKTDIKDLKEGQSRIEQTLNATHDQVSINTEGINSIKEELDTIEAVTKENLYDIAKLKLVK